MAKHYSLDQLREKALSGDVSYDLHRLYSSSIQAGDPEVLDVLKTGHVSEAADWLRSTTPEAMEYGTFSREERINKAAGHAAAAGYPLEVIAEQHDLTHLL